MASKIPESIGEFVRDEIPDPIRVRFTEKNDAGDTVDVTLAAGSAVRFRWWPSADETTVTDKSGDVSSGTARYAFVAGDLNIATGVYHARMWAKDSSTGKRYASKLLAFTIASHAGTAIPTGL